MPRPINQLDPIVVYRFIPNGNADEDDDEDPPEEDEENEREGPDDYEEGIPNGKYYRIHPSHQDYMMAGDVICEPEVVPNTIENEDCGAYRTGLIDGYRMHLDLPKYTVLYGDVVKSSGKPLRVKVLGHVWRLVKQHRPKRKLPMNKIYSKPLPLP